MIHSEKFRLAKVWVIGVLLCYYKYILKCLLFEFLINLTHTEIKLQDGLEVDTFWNAA